MQKRFSTWNLGWVSGALMLTATLPAMAMTETEVKKMVDTNGDGMISRQEYVDYEAFAAAKRFDEMSGGAAMMTTSRTAEVLADFWAIQRRSGG